MYALKIKFLNKPFYAMLLAALFAGTVSCKDAKPQTAGDTPGEVVEKPEMDLQSAVIYGNLDAVKQHIRIGSDLDIKDAMSGSTALITAVTFDKADIANALIDAGANLSLKNNDGATALHVAAFFCRVELVQKLLDAGADKTLRNNFGATPRESVMGSFEEVRPVYEFMQTQLGPIGLDLKMDELEKTRPVIAMMLQ
jgi:hypothetical protein